jgi:hypothetical protein
MKGKKAGVFQGMLIQIMLIALVFILFFTAHQAKFSGRDIKIQMIEKQTALLIDSAIPGMSFTLFQLNLYGSLDNLELKEGKVYATLDGLPSVKGYPYLSPYRVSLTKTEKGYVVEVKA